ncbi:hypothetical protein [Streptosporangium sp. NPDC049078]|uniref:hypothetical protein n=1 Tax=Streptosporangium sp. NPDC049078 TaxID=3155767 RepID=UPI00343B9B80
MIRFPAWLHRHRPDPRWRPEFDTLAQYNAERARGIQHTPEWQARMAELQAQFNAAYHGSASPTASSGSAADLWDHAAQKWEEAAAAWQRVLDNRNNGAGSR